MQTGQRISVRGRYRSASGATSTPVTALAATRELGRSVAGAAAGVQPAALPHIGARRHSGRCVRSRDRHLPGPE